MTAEPMPPQLDDDDDYRQAVALDPELPKLEKFVGRLFRGDLPGVENWVCRMNRIIESRPELRPFRKAIFSRLIRTHNEALAKHGGAA